MRATGCGLLVMLAAVVGTNAAHAAPAAGATVAVPAVTKVTVVDPPADDRILVEAGLRIRAELDAANLSNRALTCAGGIGSAACDAFVAVAAALMIVASRLVWFRATLPRYRYDQLMDLGWKVMIPLALGWMLAVAGLRVANDEGYDFGQMLVLVGGGMVVLVGAASLLSVARRTARHRREDLELEGAQ